jgi:hypothetical protein
MTSIVAPFRAALNKMNTVAEPPVASAASSASRSEMPSLPGCAFSADTEDTAPFTTSAVVVTTTTLLDTAGGGGTGADEARMSVNLNVTLLASADSLTRYWPTLSGLGPNSCFTVIVWEPRKLPRSLVLRTVNQLAPCFRETTYAKRALFDENW